MKVYHISDEASLSFTFSPRIPENRMKWENRQDKRICVAASIENCLLGRTGISGEVSPEVYRRDYCYHEVEPHTLQSVQKICTTAKRVYVADVDESKVIKPRRVPDAPVTGEMWLTEPTTMVCEGEIRISPVNTEIHPMLHDGTYVNRYWWWDFYGDEYEAALRQSISFAMSCSRHPRYQAVRMPRNGCPHCWDLYSEVHAEVIEFESEYEVLAA